MKKALVAGVLGVSGRALVQHLISLGDWEVIGLSRRRPEFTSAARFISLDLLDRAQVETRLSDIGDVTHVFFAALQMGGDFFEEVAPNLSMLVHTVETVERVSSRLRKVVLIEARSITALTWGSIRRRPGKMILRHLPPNFYYDQEDYLKNRSAGKDWSWTALAALLHLRVCRGQSDEHGDCDRRLRGALQRNGAPLPLSRLGGGGSPDH